MTDKCILRGDKCNPYYWIRFMEEPYREAALYEIERQGKPPKKIPKNEPLSEAIINMFLFHLSYEGAEFWWDYYNMLLNDGK